MNNQHQIYIDHSWVLKELSSFSFSFFVFDLYL